MYARQWVLQAIVLFGVTLLHVSSGFVSVTVTPVVHTFQSKTSLLVHATLEQPASSAPSDKDKNAGNAQQQRKTFEQRMRRLLRNDSHNGTSSSSSVKDLNAILPENLMVVDTLSQYKIAVGDENEKIVVVRFFAPWCKACRAIQPLFYRLSQQYPDVKFVEVPVTEKNTALHQGLGVPSLPFGHIYFPETGLVDELRISRKFFPQLELALKSYLDGSCDLIDDDALNNPYASQSEE